MLKKLAIFTDERVVFYSVLSFNIFLLCTLRFYPSGDGPAHLYNANILYHLIKGTPSIEAFYAINKLPIPNWTAHFILVLGRFFMPGWAAEKMFLLMYVAGMALSFRFLVKQLTPGNAALSVFIFPFIYTFLFHMGFYNYSFSFIFLFLAIGYWIKTREKKGGTKHFILLLVILGSYFSNVVGFVFTGICLSLFIISYAISDHKYRMSTVFLKALFQKFFYLFLTALPSLICLAIFYKSTVFPSENRTYSAGELVKWLNDVRPLIVYGYPTDEKLTAQFLHIMIAIASASLAFRYRSNTRWEKNDIILVSVAIALTLLFCIPDGASAGMMSTRYCQMAYMLFIIWVSIQPLPKMMLALMTGLILIFHFALLLTHYNESIKALNKDAVEINHAAEYIEPGSVILPVNMSNHWIEGHFSNYVGIDKPLIILENYEASIGWFPLLWNFKQAPQVKIAGQTQICDLFWFQSPKSKSTREVDYVLLYGNTKAIDDEKWTTLCEIIQTHYLRVYTSENGYAALFKCKK